VMDHIKDILSTLQSLLTCRQKKCNSVYASSVKPQGLKLEA
jgi:hypothetical protein